MSSTNSHLPPTSAFVEQDSNNKTPAVARTGSDDEPKSYHSVPESGDAEGVGLARTVASAQMDDVENQPPAATEERPSARFQPMEQDQGHYHDLDEEEDYLDIIPPTSEVLQGWWDTLVGMLKSSLTIFHVDHLTLVQASYLGLAAILGTLLRIVLAQLLGEECKNPGTVGWLASSSPLCVTTNGQTDQIGGIIFADLPSNMLGSFFMGLLQDGSSLGLAIPTPIAWLNPSNIFQGYTILHLALKTGFCGSLTTFSSWNSEMVVMLIGKAATHRESQIWKALFGYIIGFETALGSYMFGRTVACWLHKWKNPSLGKEMVAIRERRRLGYVVNHHLPTLERRFLPDLSLYIEGEYPPSPETILGLSSLAQWRESTLPARRLEHASSQALQEFETAILGNHQPMLDDAEAMCRKEGWDVDALKDYLRAQGPALEAQLMTSSYLTASGIRKSDENARMFRWPYATALWGAVLAILATLLATIDIQNAYDITYRTMVYGMIFATPGALLRWQLATRLNGKYPSNTFQWIPSGTLMANWLGSMISIAMIAAEYRLEENAPYGFWKVATFRAIRIGLCGCLTTVSTFIAEIHGMMLQHQPDRAYKYATLSLVGAAILSAIIFSLIVYTAPVY